MVTSEEFAVLKAAVTRLEAIVGLRFMDAPVTPDMLVPANELSNGRYPQPLSDFQLHTTLGWLGGTPTTEGVVPKLVREVKDIYEKIDALVVSPLPAPVVIPPAPPVVETPPVDVVSSGLIVGESGIFWLPAPHGGGSAIYFESDTNFTGGQRPKDENGNPTRYRQVFGFSQSHDGGGGMHMNIVYPENGEPSYIPDPTRFAMSYRLDRQGMMSINIHRAGREFAPGKYTPVAIHKGQLGVLIPDENGDFTLRLPQGGRFMIEEGEGNSDHNSGIPPGEWTGHQRTRSRRQVLLGPDVRSAATGGLPGGGGT